METRKTPAALAIDPLRMDARAAFDVAAGAAYRGIAFGTGHPELNPDALGESARRHVQSILNAKGLTIATIRTATPAGALSQAGSIDRTLDNARKAILLARQMHVGTVSLNVGQVDYKGPMAVTPDTMLGALRELAQLADASGVSLALSDESGGRDLPAILKALDFPQARLHLDTARTIGAGQDVLQTAESLAPYLGAVTLADALRRGSTVQSEPLGEGQLPLRELVAFLKEGGLWQGSPMIVDVRELRDPKSAAERAAQLLL